jgi:hypothetical protein
MKDYKKRKDPDNPWVLLLALAGFSVAFIYFYLRTPK